MDPKPAPKDLPPVPATAIPAMPASNLPPKRPEPILSKFHLDPDEQRILNLANETNQGLARCFDQINRLLISVKPQLDALTAADRAKWTLIDGTPPDEAMAAIDALESVLHRFVK